MAESHPHIPHSVEPDTAPGAVRAVAEFRRTMNVDPEIVASLGNGLPGGAELVGSPVGVAVFGSQVDVEKSGPMDLVIQARQLWRTVAVSGITGVGGTAGEKTAGEDFFERYIVAGLHEIDMSELVHDDLLGALPAIIDRYADMVSGLAIWSTGDTKNVYQLRKILMAHIIEEFSQMLHERMSDPKDADRFMMERTAFLVSADKYGLMVERVGRLLESHEGEGPLKITVIEDSQGAFEKVEKLLAKEFGEGRVQVGKIWYRGSREGETAEKKVRALEDEAKHDPGNTDKLERAEAARRKLEEFKTEHHSIRSFHELLDVPMFRELFRDSYVFCDFDGVIGDNIAMRERQVVVIVGALIRGMQIDNPELSTEEALRLLQANAPISRRVADKLATLYPKGEWRQPRDASAPDPHLIARDVLFEEAREAGDAATIEMLMSSANESERYWWSWKLHDYVPSVVEVPGSQEDVPGPQVAAAPADQSSELGPAPSAPKQRRRSIGDDIRRELELRPRAVLPEVRAFLRLTARAVAGSTVDRLRGRPARPLIPRPARNSFEASSDRGRQPE